MPRYAQRGDIVYMELCNAFPMVDLRLLKAVAFENHTDYDAAFRAVVYDILPHIPEGTNSTDLSQKDLSPQPIAWIEAAEHKVLQEVDSLLSFDSLMMPKPVGNPLPGLNAQECLQKVSNIKYTDELITLCKGLANHLNVVPETISRVTSIHDDLEGKFMSSNLSGRNTQSSFMAEDMVLLSEGNGYPAFVYPLLERPDEYLIPSGIIDSGEVVDYACEFQDGPCSAVSGIKLEDLNGVSVLQQGSSEINWSDVKNKMPGNDMAFPPCQTRKIQVVELSIEEAKTIKQTLSSSLATIRNAIRKVEEKEKAVGKDKVAFEGLGNLSRAEELKTMLWEAKRDLNMTEERDNASCILNEMQHSVQSRLSAADEEIRKCKEEKLNEENSVKKYFSGHVVLDMIALEAKVLQLEAEENSKLPEFQADRSVTCQDVKSPKCQFDEWVLLGESVASSEESCILASSTSSRRSISSQSLSDQESTSEPGTPAKQHTDFDEDGWEFV